MSGRGSARVGNRWARALVGLLGALALMGCDGTDFSSGAPASCTEVGAQCRLPNGPLGVCERSHCPAGQTPPCFQCTPQH